MWNYSFVCTRFFRRWRLVIANTSAAGLFVNEKENIKRAEIPILGEVPDNERKSKCYLCEKDIRKMLSIIERSFQKVTVMVETMSPFVVKHVKEKSIEGSNAKFTWGVKNGTELQKIVPNFSILHEVSLVEGMKELMPVYCVIGKIPAVRNISNKIIVLKKRG